MRPVLAPGVLLQHRLEPRLQARLRLRHRHARLQPAEHVEPDAAPIEQPVEIRRRLPLHHRRDPDGGNFAPVDSVEAFRRHANNRHRMRVDENGAPDDVGPAAKVLLPVVVRQHDDRMRVRLAIIGLVQQPAELRTNAENREVGAGDDLGADRLSGVLEKQIHGRRGATEDAVEDVGLVVQILEERVRLQVAAAPPVADERALPVQEDELPGIPNREHAKQRLIDQGKDRRVRANAKTDRQQRRQRESAILPQRTKTQTDVAQRSWRSCPRWTPAGRKRFSL